MSLFRVLSCKYILHKFLLVDTHLVERPMELQQWFLHPHARLFSMINELPTVFEVLSGGAKKPAKTKSSISNNGSSKSKSNSNSKSGKHSKGLPSVPMKEEEGLDEEEEEDHGDALCGTCGENYASDEFWICCDICERWLHGKCVKITPARAEHIKQYKCPSCTSNNKRARPS